MGWGSSKSTTQDSTQQQNSVNANMPVQLPWVAQMQKGMAPQYQNLIAQANAPVYGDAQKASYMENLNDLANSATSHLSSTLAGSGQLNSGQFGKAATGIEQQKFGQESNFFSQLPAMERQAHMQNMMGALGAANGFLSSTPTGNISTGSSSGSSDSSSVEKSSPGLSGLVGGLMGMALGPMMGGLGGGIAGGMNGMFGGQGSFGQGYNQAMAPPSNPFNMQVPAQGMQFSPPMQQQWNPTAKY